MSLGRVIGFGALVAVGLLILVGVGWIAAVAYAFLVGLIAVCAFLMGRAHDTAKEHGVYRFYYDDH
jgi:hypothetical protein